MNFDETSEKTTDNCDKILFQIEDLMITLNDKQTLEELWQKEEKY